MEAGGYELLLPWYHRATISDVTATSASFLIATMVMAGATSGQLNDEEVHLSPNQSSSKDMSSKANAHPFYGMSVDNMKPTN